MARMYSRARGKHGSKKPIKKSVPSWLNYKKKEVEILVAKAAKEGLTPSLIGIHLRDSYGIPDVKLITGKTITRILKEKNLQPKLPEDLVALMKRVVAVRKHYDENPQDTSALRGIQITESKIRKVINYYKRSKILSKDWKYDPTNIRLYIE
ncbi:MAG: 30S ribosomal protein S15 [Candidatus Woesearchaeota archaeon]